MNDRYTIYTNKDNRTRIYDKETKKVISYPRFLMAEKLGRPLNPDEQVHHIDGNPLNNDFSNLEVLSSTEHARLHGTKYHDTIAICAYCGNEFLWTAKSQLYFNGNRNRGHSKSGPYCSKKCAGLGSKPEHIDRNIDSECE